MFTPASPLSVSADQKRELDRLGRNGSSPQKVALRCKILLLACEGVPNHAIAEELNVSRPTILALRAAFAEKGMVAVTGIRRRKRSRKVLTPRAEDSRYHVEDASGGWQHPLERADTGPSDGGV